MLREDLVDFSRVYLSMQAALQDVDLVIHAAGPFQQTADCSVLEAAIETKTNYLDVCDDPAYALR